ncbi:MAG: hypothetical protein PVJ84_00580 [Desulfobacteraceae bacterium]|jgi:hypothetical protein
MHPIIALWTHPRSISTAFERVMMERGDLKILHEPFSYLYYVEGDDATISQQYVDPDHPTDYSGIKSHIENAAAGQSVFFKDMCAHGYDRLVADDTFLNRLTNTFLIRDPAKAIASYYALNPDVTVEEIGLKQLCGIYEKTKAIGGAPIVVDADDLEDNPEGTIRAYCQALGIDFIPESMTWDSGQKSEWEIWKDWHKDAARSTGIQKSMEKFETTVENSDHLKRFYDDQLPFYRIMYAGRIQPIPSDSGM